jgi:glycosyltransferase involved in cell wall biosynthesis
MNVCHVITRLIVGGAQENTLLTCEGLHARGHRVTLLTGPDSGPEGSLLHEARSGGFEVVMVPPLRRAIRPLADLRACRQLRRVFERLRPDVVHTHSSKAGILARYAARDAGVPIIVHTIHGMSFNRTQPAAVRWLYRQLETRCARFTDRLIGVADAMARQSIEAGVAPAEKFVTIYSGMRTDWYDPTRHDRQAIHRSWGFTDEHVVFGTVARLFRNKGYEQLIPAMAEAARLRPALRFVWVGDGAQRREYEGQLDRLGIRERVCLTGLVRPEEVPGLLAGMDGLVHASQWEGLPRAAVQALLMQRPVISFDIDGAPEIVLPEQTGLLVPFNDVSALADAMVRLAEEPDLRDRMGRAGRDLCLKRFDHNAMVEAIDRLYNELADHRGTRQSAS